MAGYRKGLVDLGSGIYAYLQPDGGWGWSNAGLIRDGDAALLIDTLFDETLTADMLDTMRDATGLGAGDIGTVVNTHANGDHTHGNALLPDAEIIASEASAREMEAFSPAMLAQLTADGAAGLPAGLNREDVAMNEAEMAQIIARLTDQVSADGNRQRHHGASAGRAACRRRDVCTASTVGGGDGGLRANGRCCVLRDRCGRLLALRWCFA